MKTDQININSITELQKRFLTEALNGEHELTQMTSDISFLKFGFEFTYKNLFIHSLHQLGSLWLNGALSIAHEHRASQMIISCMDNTMANLPKPKSNHLIAITTTLENDLHWLPSRIAKDLLFYSGYMVDFLGPETPVVDLLEIIEERNPHLLVIPFTVKSDKNYSKFIDFMNSDRKYPYLLAGGIHGKEMTKSISSKKTFFAEDLINGCQKITEIINNSLPEIDHEKQFLKKIGANIKNYREQSGLSQSALSKETGIDRSYLSSVEKGNQNISLLLLERIARATGTSASALTSRN